MAVRQLEEFLGQADQKGFWIFSYANLGGAFLGAFAGNSLLESSAPVFKLPCIALGVLLGVVVTWKLKGYPIYRWVLSYLIFLLRRYLKVGLGDSVIDASTFYRARTVRQEPFMLVATQDGKPVPVLVHRGSGTGSPADLLDGLFVPARGEAVRRKPEHQLSVTALTPPPTLVSGEDDFRGSSPSHRGTVPGDSSIAAPPSANYANHPSFPDYSDWEL